MPSAIRLPPNWWLTNGNAAGGYVAVDPGTTATSIPGVFAAGD